MSFPLKALRLTRRAEVAYPRLVRDRSVLPKVKIAVQYFEQMLGRERRELEPEMLVHFFGDHKLARCMIGCLGRAYRFRTPSLLASVSRGAQRRLARHEIDSPRALRVFLFDRVNEADGGFLADDVREERHGILEDELGLRHGQLDRLLWLDADEHALLTRVGLPPVAEDVVAQHNVGVLLTLLRHAERVDLDLAPLGPAERDGIARIVAANGVAAWLDEDRPSGQLRLAGRQDALGSWSRHGRWVARTVVELLERDPALVMGGSLRLRVKERVATVRLTPEMVAMLAGPAAGAGWLELPGWSVEDVRRDVAEARGSRETVTLRRLPDPQAWVRGTVLPDLLVEAAGQSALVVAVRSVAHAERMAEIVPLAGSGEPYLFVGAAEALGPLRAAGLPVLAAAALDLGAIATALRGSLPNGAADRAA
jgi:hypothetical protein